MYSEGPCEQKPIKNFGENGAWAYTGTAQIFWVPPIIPGTDKATIFKFCTHILSIDQNNSPLKISGAVAGCVVRTLKTFKCIHILGASRGLLCDSYAILLRSLTIVVTKYVAGKLYAYYTDVCILCGRLLKICGSIFRFHFFAIFNVFLFMNMNCKDYLLCSLIRCGPLVLSQRRQKVLLRYQCKWCP